MNRNKLVQIGLFSLLMILIPCLFLIAYSLFNITFLWKPFLLGALGWYIALMIRFPFIFIIRKLHISEPKKTTFTILLSGPTEETTRLVCIFLIGFNFHNALVLGLGWASIEVIYAIVQGIGTLSLRDRTDEKALKAKKMLEEQGLGVLLQEHSPLFGVLERISATFIHLAFSILLVVNPYFVLIDMVIHSSINIFSVHFVKKSILFMETGLFLISALLLSIGLLLHFG